MSGCLVCEFLRLCLHPASPRLKPSWIHEARRSARCLGYLRVCWVVGVRLQECLLQSPSRL